ncbi:DUF2848 domain-containing protein [Ottowia thiooxydans]|uniref:DUF2848 domain-containing protein n=1 Tax=Ottowia thiooxydans TaxID=219182 RepID=UPI00040618EA|nr:DUF2848 domain-containing protein [Ottowia thiooxydans]
MTFTLHFSSESVDTDGATSTRLVSVEPQRFVIAGWTGRDAAAIQHHIDELAEIGVPRPSAVPLYYRASRGLLSQEASVEVLGVESSGEAEPVLFFSEGEWWLTVGSDHTDRKVEGYSVAVSKQMCPKPIATAAWRWSDVAARQDEIELESRILEGGKWVTYQRGTLASIRPLASLRDGLLEQLGGVAATGYFLFCGTLGAIPNAEGKGIRAAAAMELSLRDPQSNRAIVHRYTVDLLPVIA